VTEGDLLEALRTAPSEKQRRVLDVAKSCFERYGLRRTRMEDIAAELGVSRPIVHRLYDSRQQLIDAVIIDYLREFVGEIRPMLMAYESFADVVAEGSVRVIAAARQHAQLTALVTADKRSHVHGVLLNPARIAHAMAVEVWHPLIERARQRGEIRADLDEDDFVEWLTSIHWLFWLRADTDLDWIRRQLRFFLVPSLRPDAAGQ
jgi:AcrR family transcriptional regulator